LKSVRERLEQELREARAELARLDEVVQVKGDYGMGKGDPLVVRWESNLALRAKAETQVQEIERALERLDEGAYGICESCGQPIDPARLEVLPHTALCINCARRQRNGVSG
jgi:DnaK suppressor protein